MINCNYLGFNEHILLGNIIEDRNDPYKTDLETVRSRVLASYDQYLNNFSSLELKNKSDFASEPQVIAALKLCYSSRSDNSVFKFVRGKIFQSQPDYLKLLCPYCLIESPQTIDHYIGQNAFPEFCTLLRNLIPSCNTCNLKKLENWRKNKKRRYIHYYNDTFLNHQFLKASITYSRGNNIPKIRMFLKKPVGMTKYDFTIVKCHFKDLGLIDKYITRASNIVSSENVILKNAINRGIPRAEIANQLNDRYLSLRASLGINYYQAVIYQSMANTSKFINKL